jgi:Ca2+-transporting ATPase
MQLISQPWSQTVEETLENLESSHAGLTQKEAELRTIKFGNNTFHNAHKKGIFSILIKQFVSPLIFLLIAASFLTASLGEWIDTGVILFAVLINIVLGCYHEYNAENTLDKLGSYIKDRSKVIRDGFEQEIDSSAIVPGDIIRLSYGSRIPADARIISVNNLRVDEAVLTGESLPVDKDTDSLPLSSELPERKNIVHAGTLVVEGFGSAVVYATGNNTEIGHIAGIVSRVEKSKTPLQKGVDKLAWFIFVIVIAIVCAIFVLGLFRGVPLLPMLLLASAVAVGAVPEALPIALTVILAIGAMKVASKKGIIRTLSAAETLGSTTMIMTDKTGTLTKADMQLVGVVSFVSIVSGRQAVTEENFGKEENALLETSLSNVDVHVENPNDPEEKWNFRGRPFEVDIVKACRAAGISLECIMTKTASLILPFNSTNKFSVADTGDSYTLMGAPDILLKKARMSKEDYIKTEEWIERTSREGKRLIGLAIVKKHHTNQTFDLTKIEHVEFLGMLLFFDPIRTEVPQAIRNIESHGMKMVLVTGDLPGTALSVAKDLDWSVQEDQVILGSDLRKMNDTELLSILPKTKIFARVTPEDKLRIGLLYQKLGEVVAMTGDGVNDAPSLKAMDIGISLGSGSDVAKSAADMVLLDDNFETISLAIDEGRKILGNVRKTFVYLMSNSLDEVFVIGGSLLLGLPLPITALQIIWVNLFTGSLPALSFAFDEDIDREKYSGRDLKLIFTKEVKALTLGIGVLSSLCLFLVYYFLQRFVSDTSLVRSIFFVCFSSYILAITFSFRSLHKSLFSFDVFSNMKLNISILISIALLIATMTVPLMRDVFSIAPLPIVWIPFMLLWLIFNVLLVEGTKYLLRRKFGHTARFLL